MVVYNVTYQVDPTIVKQWLQWMENEHMPEMLATLCFKEAKLLQVCTDTGQPTGSYAIQFLAANQKQLDTYLKKHREKLQQASSQYFGEKALAFRTQLEVIRLFQ